MAVRECSRCEGVHYLSNRCHPELLEHAAAARERRRIVKMLKKECQCEPGWVCSLCHFAAKLKGKR